MPSPEEGNIRRKLGRATNANVDRAAFDISRQAEEVRRGTVDTARVEFQRNMNRMHAHVKHHGIHAVQIRGIAAKLGPYNARTHTYALRGTKGQMSRISVHQLHILLFGGTGPGPGCDSQCADILHGKK